MAVDQGEKRERARNAAESIQRQLDALTASARALAEGASLTETLDAIVAAAASALEADVVVARVLDSDDRLTARAVSASSSALAAELAGSRLPASELPDSESDELDKLPEAIRVAAARAGAEVVLSLPLTAGRRTVGSLEVMRSGRFSEVERHVARVVAGHLATAIRVLAPALGGDRAGRGGPHALDIAGEALAAASDRDRAAHEITRLAAEATGAQSAMLWLLSEDGDDARTPVATFGAELEPSVRNAARELVAQALGAPSSTLLTELSRNASDGASAVATVQLGQPPIAALQLFFPPGAVPSDGRIAAVAAFGLRAGAALRAGLRAAELAEELDRTRALLSVVAGVTSDLSLAHAVETFVERVGDLLGSVGVGVYLLEDARLVEAAGRRLAGPHVPVAERLLELALARRHGSGVLEVGNAAVDFRLAGLEDALSETGIEAAVAVPLRVAGELTGLLAVYPPSSRLLTESESALLVALAGLLAVALQNARLHEQATHLGAELEDVLAAERQAARHLRSLYEISRSFAQSLSLEATLEAIVRAVVELLDVDAAVIRMPDPRGEALEPRAMHVADSRLAEPIRAILSRPQPLDELLNRRLLRTGRPMVLDARAASRLTGSYQLLVPFLEKGSTAVVVPIATPTELLGTLKLVSLDPGRRITSETTDLALSVAGQAALALENARLYQQQKAFADAMQRSLLPREEPRLPGLDVGAVYESSARVDVGGDVYDFLQLEDGRLAVVLGDVTGHGIEAAADMAMAKFVFRSLAREHADPGDFLAAANEVVCGEIGPGKFITMVYVTIDADRGEAACASAGHPQPRLVLPDGSVQPLPAGGLALGIEGEQHYEEVRATVPPGASVVVYTDGVVEARRGSEQYGTERLDRVLSERRAGPAADMASAALAGCRAFAGGELLDDCALVVIKRTA